MKTLALSLLGILLVSCNAKKPTKPQVENWGEPPALPVVPAVAAVHVPLSEKGTGALLRPLPKMHVAPPAPPVRPARSAPLYVVTYTTAPVVIPPVQPAAKPYDGNAWKRDLAIRQAAIRAKYEAESIQEEAAIWRRHQAEMARAQEQELRHWEQMEELRAIRHRIEWQNLELHIHRWESDPHCW